MSISRKIENQYNHSKRCVKAITGEQVDHQRFAALIDKQFGILTKLEEERFILFKFSESLQELTQLLGLNSIDYNKIEENHNMIQNNQQIQKIQIQKRLELNNKTLNPVKNMPKFVDQINAKQMGIIKLESDLMEGKEIRDGINVKDINQNVIKNTFFIQRKSIQAENLFQKTLEQKEREFLDKFKQVQEDQ